jgi:hypothetical protein
VEFEKGATVSSMVAPSTATISVIHNVTFAWAYGGMPFVSDSSAQARVRACERLPPAYRHLSPSAIRSPPLPLVLPVLAQFGYEIFKYTKNSTEEKPSPSTDTETLNHYVNEHKCPFSKALLVFREFELIFCEWLTCSHQRGRGHHRDGDQRCNEAPN